MSRSVPKLLCLPTSIPHSGGIGVSLLNDFFLGIASDVKQIENPCLATPLNMGGGGSAFLVPYFPAKMCAPNWYV